MTNDSIFRFFNICIISNAWKISKSENIEHEDRYLFVTPFLEEHYFLVQEIELLFSVSITMIYEAPGSPLQFAGFT